MSRRQRRALPSDSEEEDDEVATTEAPKSEAPKKEEKKPAGKETTKKDEKKGEKKETNGAVANGNGTSNGTAQDFACWNCDSSLYGCRFVNKDSHPYCVKCYNELFANSCVVCKEVISVDHKDLAFKDKHWHEKCFKCVECKSSLVNQSFGAKEDKLYCSDCWDQNFAPKCTKCSQPFKAGTMKLSWNGGEWHKECFTCTNCDKVIGQEAFHPQDGKPYCEGCWEDLFAIKCTKCNEAIKQGGVTYKLEPYHKECFTCFECETSLAGQRFTLKDDNPICAECFGKHYAYKCFECGEAITGLGGNRYIIFENQQWHTQCFNCKECSASLVGVNFVAEGYDQDLEIFCQPCGFQKRGMDFTMGGNGGAQKAEMKKVKESEEEAEEIKPRSRASKK